MPFPISSATLSPRTDSAPTGAAPAPGFASALKASETEALAKSQPTSTHKGARVEPMRTPISGTQAAEAIAKAYRRVMGEEPSKETLAILTSHWSLETAQGTKMYNFNFAGIKGTSPEGMTAVLKTREGYGETEVHIKSGFRAYGSTEAGAVDYVSLLARRYGSAVQAAKAGDPTGFAMALKDRGYYTGNEQLYSRGIASLANRAMSLGLDALGATEGPSTRSAVAVEEYFGVPNFERGLTRGRFESVAGLSAVYGEGSLDYSGILPQGPWVDEVTRAALQIAAEHGAKS